MVGETLVASLDVEAFVLGGGASDLQPNPSGPPGSTPQQRIACTLFGPLWFLGLHMTYQNFLFPVLTSLDVVLLSCCVKLAKGLYEGAQERDFSPLFKELVARRGGRRTVNEKECRRQGSLHLGSSPCLPLDGYTPVDTRENLLFLSPERDSPTVAPYSPKEQYGARKMNSSVLHQHSEDPGVNSRHTAEDLVDAAPSDSCRGFDDATRIHLIRAEAKVLETRIFSRLLKLLIGLTSPFLFGCILAFHEFGWNRGMFYDHAAPGSKLRIFRALLLNLSVALLELVVYTGALWRWREGLAEERRRRRSTAQPDVGTPLDIGRVSARRAGDGVFFHVVDLACRVAAQRALLLFGCWQDGTTAGSSRFRLSVYGPVVPAPQSGSGEIEAADVERRLSVFAAFDDEQKTFRPKSMV